MILPAGDAGTARAVRARPVRQSPRHPVPHRQATGSSPQLFPLLPRLPLPRQPFRLGDLLGGHLGGNDFFIMDSIIQIPSYRCRVPGSRKIQPHMSLNVVPRYPLAFRVHEAEIHLRIRQSLISGPSVPLRRLGVVLRKALSLVVHEAEVVLGLGESLIGGPSVPFPCLGGILRDPSAVIVHDTEVVLGLDVSFFRL